MIMDFLLKQGTVSRFDLSELYAGGGGFSISTEDESKAAARIEDGVLTIAPGALGHADFELTYTDAGGVEVTDSFRAIVAGPDAYSFAVIPDTQSYTSAGSAEVREMFGAMIDYIADHKDALNIARAIHVGDITDNNIASQWAVAQDAMSRLDGVLDYTLAVGNHDQAAGGSASDFTSGIDDYFSAEALGVEGTYDGYDQPSLRNSYDTFQAPDGTDWLILSLEFGAPDDVLRWASEVVEDHLDHRVIIDTHSWNGGDKRVDPTTEPLTGENGGWGYGIREDARNVNDGEDMWRDFAAKYPNIAFTFNGHNFLDGAETVVDETAGGGSVFQMFVNYQNGISGEITGAGDPALGGRAGNGAFRLVVVDPDNGVISTHAKFTALDRFFERVDHQETFTGVDLGPVGRIAIAKAGEDRVVAAGADGEAMATLDPSASLLPGEGRELTYAWFAADGEKLGETAGEPLEVALGYGVNRLTLAVSDAQGAVSRDSVTLHVEGPESLLTETFDDGRAQGWAAPDAASPIEFGTDLGYSLPAVGEVEQIALTLSFDSSFRPYDDMTGRVLVSFDGGQSYAALRSFTTANSGGNSSLDHVNERVAIDFLAPVTAESVSFAWRLEEADNDWWWAIDDPELTARTPDGPTTLWRESFDALADRLQPAVDESIPEDVLGWTREGPEGWEVETSPDTSQGTTEWQGWSFATPEFWTAADRQERGAFTLGDGVVAIADPDEWDDFNGGAAGDTNEFDSALRSPAVDLAAVGGGQTAAGEEATVARIEALGPDQALRVKPAAEGALHEYTLIFDILAESPSQGYAALYQTDPTNGTDAEAYIIGSGGVGISSVYQGEFAFGAWNRLAITVAVEDGDQIMRKHIDGEPAGEQTLVSGFDAAAGSRWSIDADQGFLLFADPAGYTSRIHANAVAFTPGALSDAEIAALGGATAQGPLAEAQAPGAFQLDFDGALDSQDFGAAEIDFADLDPDLGSFRLKGSYFGNPDGEGEAALYAQTDGPDEVLVYQGAGASEWSDYVFDMVVHPSDNDAVGAVFYWLDADNHYELEIDQQSFTRTLTRVRDGERTVLAQEAGGYRHHVEQDLRIAAGATGVTVTLDEELLFGGPVEDDAPLEGGAVGVLARGMHRASFDEVSVNGQLLSARALGERRATDLDGDGAELLSVTAAATISPQAVAAYDWLIDGELVATGREAQVEAGIGESELVLRVTDAGGAVSEDAMTLSVVGADAVLLAEGFDAPADGFRIVDAGDRDGPSDWRVEEGAFLQDSNINSDQQDAGWGAWSLGGEGAYILRDGTYALHDDPAALRWSDYAVEVQVTPADDDGFGLLFRYSDAENFYKFEIDDQQGLAQMIRVEDGYETVLARAWANYAQDEPLDLRVEVEGERIAAEIDGKSVFAAEISDDAFAAGTVALYGWASEGLAFDDLAVTRLGEPEAPRWTRISGTEGRDRLEGTEGDDLFDILLGADTVRAGGGDDVFDLSDMLDNGARDSLMIQAEAGQSVTFAGLSEAEAGRIVERGARVMLRLGEDGDAVTVLGVDAEAVAFEPDALLFA